MTGVYHRRYRPAMMNSDHSRAAQWVAVRGLGIFLQVVTRVRLVRRLGLVIEMFVEMLMLVAQPIAAGGSCFPMGSAQIRLSGAFGMRCAR